MVLINQTNVLRALVVILAMIAKKNAALEEGVCNICGEGNSIQYPTGVVNFQYKGQPWKQNCQSLQNVVKNPVAISDNFCRNELLAYTHAVCRCTTPDGSPYTYVPPTTSPAPVAAPTAPAPSPESVEDDNDGGEPTEETPDSNSGDGEPLDETPDSGVVADETPDSGDGGSLFNRSASTSSISIKAAVSWTIVAVFLASIA